MIDHTKWKKYLQIYIYMYVYIIYNTQRRSKILLVSEKLIKRERFTHGMIAISFLSFKLNTSLFFSFFFFRYLREIRRAKIFITLSRYFYLFFIFPFFFFFNHHSLRLFSPIEKFETTIAKKKIERTQLSSFVYV